MLLSMCASYLWAKELSKEDYVLTIAVFIILISLLPAIIGITMNPFWLICFPFTFLSFPFYAYGESIVWIRNVRIRFLTIDLTNPLSFDLGTLLVAFPLFLLVNISGALLGYWMGKKLKMEFLGSGLWIVFFGSVGISSIGLSFLLAGFGAIGEIAWTTFFGFGTFLLEAIFLSKTWRTILLV
jgi:hypothetical protein